jgi:hypothetical protein
MVANAQLPQNLANHRAARVEEAVTAALVTTDEMRPPEQLCRIPLSLKKTTTHSNLIRRPKSDLEQ